jgi:hypothetical protein
VERVGNFIYLYGNRTRKPVEVVLGRWRGGMRENDGGGESNQSIYVNLCKCHNELSIQLIYTN